ncbi:hypothetical protein HT665_01435 [Ursidibacter maritimus]|uniref:Uncharacterized protein n=1 Tax=Ursidibacter maritimus TaxID=1331689 RepID=A0A949T3X2_9PAST|nr:hypothetical protein [Ursidibacter maritimus]KAE9539231.1 hypothetical protein A1D26_04195 [Ursidibacter maritimus]MBV6524589.1 hypothetical protein [Ursidibacter maritimus]MBV6525436.1 hypothetical protein [Ursidibacter maritimus]MBV6526906.1 hypothetical protein [Ursidibacter maritimus]MBV6530377.1 hypothetical protein [Ursidibacter maritimus]
MVEKSDVLFVDKQKASRINSKLQLLAEDTIDLLFNRASVVKDDDSVNEDYFIAIKKKAVKVS